MMDNMTMMMGIYTLIIPVCCAFSTYQHQKISRWPPLFATTTIDDDVDSKVSPFNHDIARTIFAPLFFSLYYDKNNNNEVRHQYQRPSPFENPGCAQTSERMLRRMLDNRSRSDGRTVCPDSQTFSLVAGAFGRLRYVNESSKGSKRSSKIVTWEEEQTSNGKGQKRIKVTSTDKLQQLLQLQLQLCNKEGWPTAVLPSVEMYNRVLKRLAQNQNKSRYQQKDDEVSAAEQAWLWLHLMKSPLPHNEESIPLCQPSIQTYSHVISALTSYREQTRNMNTKPLIDTPLKRIYEPIDYFAKQIDIEIEKPPSKLTLDWCLHEAEALLTIIEDEYNSRIEKNVDLSTDKMKDTLTHAYKCILEGWGRYAVIKSKESNVESSKRAYELLTRLEELPNTTSVSSSCYSSVILALSVSNLPTAAADAEDVLQRMMNQYGISQSFDINEVRVSSANFNVNDVSKAFSGCIGCHAKNNDAPQSELVLNRMIELYDSGKLGDDFAPEPRAFGTCISLWAKYDPMYKERRPNNRQRGGKDLTISREQRLQNADRAEAILSELEGIAIAESDKGNKKFKLNATPYNLAILARCQTTMKSDKYNNNREENKQIILHAQSILDHMEYEMRVKPDAYTFAHLLTCWCQESAPGNEKAADQAEELLRRRIEDVDIEILDREWSTAKREARTAEIWPNVKHYSSVLSAHAKTKSAAGARKALALLSEMEARFYNADVVEGDDNNDDISTYHVDKKESCKPDLICYSIVIDAFANSRLPEASSVALRLLKAVETKYESDVSMKPNVRLYTAVILSLVHSPLLDDDLSDKHINNAKQAWIILEKMMDNDVQPNAYTYNYIINCAAESASGDIDDQKVSFEIALRAFQAMRKDGLCDSFTFAFMIKACNNLLPSGELRSKVISKTFVECCKSGYLNDTILDRLWRGLPPTQFYKLVGEDKSRERYGYQEKSPIKTSQLPDAWSANSMKKWSTNRSFKKKRV